MMRSFFMNIILCDNCFFYRIYHIATLHFSGVFLNQYFIILKKRSGILIPIYTGIYKIDNSCSLTALHY